MREIFMFIFASLLATTAHANVERLPWVTIKEQYKVYYEEGLTKQEVQDAMGVWNNAVGNDFMIMVEEEDNYPNIVIGVSPVFGSTLFQNALAVAFPIRSDTCMILIDVPFIKASGYDVKKILSHEIGHCLGYSHTEDPGDLMFFAYNEGQELSKEMATLTKKLRDDAILTNTLSNLNSLH